MGSDGSGYDGRNKVARLISSYDLEGMGERLATRWTGADGSRTSLRDLADEFNQALLHTAMERAGENPIDRDVEQTYETLTAGDVSEGQKAQIRNDLARAGVDTDALLDDFVSHQSVHTYLTEVREVDSPTEERDVVGNDVETLRRLLGRTTSVAEGTLDRHRSADRITLGEFDVFLDLRVLCHDCGTDRDAVALLEDGGCDCSEDADTG